jgi:hypothetical protein
LGHDKGKTGTLFGEATQTAIKNLHEKKPVFYPQRLKRNLSSVSRWT